MADALNVRSLAHAEEHEIKVSGPTPAINCQDSSTTDVAKIVSVRRGMTISAFDLADHNQVDGEQKTDPCVSFTFLFNGSGEGWFFDAQRHKSPVISLQPGRLYCSFHHQAVSGINCIRPNSRFAGLDIRLDWDVWNRMTVKLDQQLLNSDHPFHHASGAHFWHGILPVPPEMRNLIRTLFNNIHDDTSDLAIETMGLEFVDYVRAQLDQQTPTQGRFAKDALTVQIVKNNINNDLERNWSVLELANSANVSLGHLKRVFPAHTGLAVFQYLQERRLSQARLLLERGDLSVTEIALSVGYTSMSHFSALFRRRFGCSPSSVKSQG